MTRPPTLLKAAQAFEGKRILVMGDMLVDEYVFGNTERVSREAPVLILKYDHRVVVPGGAANAVSNIRSLGGHPIPLGVMGDDEAGRSLQALFVKEGIDVTGLVVAKEIPTITKTRIMAGGYHTTRQQLIRIDKEHGDHYPKPIRAALTERLSGWMPKVDAVLFSDYGYGVLSADTRSAALRLAAKRGMASVVDSRYRLTAFRGVTTATPNEVEVAQAVGMSIGNGDDASVDRAGWALMKRMNLRQGLVMTRGRLGMRVYRPRQKPVTIPIVGSDEVADVTGAGDTVSGVVALGMAAGLGLVTAAELATHAASVVVMKRGTATVSPAELAKTLNGTRAKAVSR